MMEELLATTEAFLRIHISAEGTTAIVRVGVLPSWREPLEGEPFQGVSQRVLSRFSRLIFDVSDTSTLSAHDNGRLVDAVKALGARTGSSIVIAGVAWRTVWIQASLPVFPTVEAAVDYLSSEIRTPSSLYRQTTRRSRSSNAKRHSSRNTPGQVRAVKSVGEGIERRVSSALHTTKVVLIEIALFTGAVAFVVHYASQYIPPRALPHPQAVEHDRVK
jgi:hypothetical protein